MTMIRQALAALLLMALAGCSAPVDLEAPDVPLGDFSLGHNIVVASKVQTTGTISREASVEKLTESLRFAIDERFGDYDGDKTYHFGVSIEGYILGRAGIPVVASPNSGMIIRVTVWDDAAGVKLNDPPEQMTILEQASGALVVGSGWARNADAQLRDLSVAAAKAIEDYLVQQMAEEGWFGGAYGTNSTPGSAPDGASTSSVQELLSKPLTSENES